MVILSGVLTFTQQLTWKDFGFLFQSRYLDSMVENVIESERNDPVTTGFSRCVQEEGRWYSWITVLVVNMMI